MQHYGKHACFPCYCIKKEKEKHTLGMLVFHICGNMKRQKDKEGWTVAAQIVVYI